MGKNETSQRWIENLRFLMDAKKMNPRSLSLKAGLNATAVRDMLEGRAKFPRYDTVEALAEALEVTPAQLMGGKGQTIRQSGKKDPLADDDLNLLTEIISRLQEVAQEHRHNVGPNEFAAMVTTIYRAVQKAPQSKGSRSKIDPQIDHLLAYESLRRKGVSRN